MALNEGDNPDNQHGQNEEQERTDLDPSKITIDSELPTQADLTLGKKSHLQRMMDGENGEGEEEEEEGGDEVSSLGALGTSIATGDSDQVSADGEISFENETLTEEKEEEESSRQSTEQSVQIDTAVTGERQNNEGRDRNVFRAVNQQQEQQNQGVAGDDDEDRERDDSSEEDTQEEAEDNENTEATTQDPASNINYQNIAALNETAPAGGEASAGQVATGAAQTELQEEKAQEEADKAEAAAGAAEKAAEEAAEEEAKEEEEQEENEAEDEFDTQPIEVFIKPDPKNIAEVFEQLINGDINASEAAGFLSTFAGGKVAGGLSSSLVNAVNSGSLSSSNAQNYISLVNNGSFTNPVAEELFSLMNDKIQVSEGFAIAGFMTQAIITEADTLALLNTADTSGTPYEFGLLQILELLNDNNVTRVQAQDLLTKLNDDSISDGNAQTIVAQIGNGIMTPLDALELAQDIPAANFNNADLELLLTFNELGYVKGDTPTKYVDLVADGMMNLSDAKAIITLISNDVIQPNIGGVLLDLKADGTLTVTEVTDFANAVISNGVVSDTTQAMFDALADGDIVVDSVANLLAVELSGEPYADAVDQLLADIVSGTISDEIGASALLEDITSAGLDGTIAQRIINYITNEALSISHARNLVDITDNGHLTEIQLNHFLTEFDNGDLTNSQLGDIIEMHNSDAPYPNDAISDFIDIILTGNSGPTDLLVTLEKLDDPDVTAATAERIFNLHADSELVNAEIDKLADHVAATTISDAEAGRILDVLENSGEPYDGALGDFMDLVTNNRATGDEAASLFEQIADSNVSPATAEAIHDALAATISHQQISAQTALDLVSVVADSANGVIDDTLALTMLTKLQDEDYFHEDDIQEFVGAAKYGEPYTGAVEDFVNYLPGANNVISNQIRSVFDILTDDAQSGARIIPEDVARNIGEIGLSGTESVDFRDLIQAAINGDIYVTTLDNIATAFGDPNITYTGSNLSAFKDFVEAWQGDGALRDTAEDLSQAIVNEDITNDQAQTIMKGAANDDISLDDVNTMLADYNVSTPQSIMINGAETASVTNGSTINSWVSSGDLPVDAFNIYSDTVVRFDANVSAENHSNDEKEIVFKDYDGNVVKTVHIDPGQTSYVIDMGDVAGREVSYIKLRVKDNNGGGGNFEISNLEVFGKWNDPALSSSDTELNVAVDAAGDTHFLFRDGEAAIALSDADGSNIDFMGIYVQGAAQGLNHEAIGYSLPSGIVLENTIDNRDGTYYLEFTGNSSVADYQALLNSLTYTNTAHEPTGGTRQIIITVGDSDGQFSNSFTKDVTIQLDVPANMDSHTIPDGLTQAELNSVSAFEDNSSSTHHQVDAVMYNLIDNTMSLEALGSVTAALGTTLSPDVLDNILSFIDSHEGLATSGLLTTEDIEAQYAGLTYDTNSGDFTMTLPGDGSDASSYQIAGVQGTATNIVGGNYTLVLNGDQIFAALHNAMSNVGFANILLQEISAGNISDAHAESMIHLVTHYNLNANVAADILHKNSTGVLANNTLGNFMIMIPALTGAVAVALMDKVYAGEINPQSFEFMVDYAHNNADAEDIFATVINFIDQNHGADAAQNAALINSLFEVTPAADDDVKGDFEKFDEVIENTALTTEQLDKVIEMIDAGDMNYEVLDYLGSSGLLNERIADALQYIANGTLTGEAAHEVVTNLNDTQFDQILIFMNNADSNTNYDADIINDLLLAMHDQGHGHNPPLNWDAVEFLMDDLAINMPYTVDMGNVSNLLLKYSAPHGGNPLTAFGDSLNQAASDNMQASVKAVASNLISIETFRELMMLPHGIRADIAEGLRTEIVNDHHGASSPGALNNSQVQSLIDLYKEGGPGGPYINAAQDLAHHISSGHSNMTETAVEHLTTLADKIAAIAQNPAVSNLSTAEADALVDASIHFILNGPGTTNIQPDSAIKLLILKDAGLIDNTAFTGYINNIVSPGTNSAVIAESIDSAFNTYKSDEVTGQSVWGTYSTEVRAALEQAMDHGTLDPAHLKLFMDGLQDSVIEVLANIIDNDGLSSSTLKQMAHLLSVDPAEYQPFLSIGINQINNSNINESHFQTFMDYAANGTDIFTAKILLGKTGSDMPAETTLDILYFAETAGLTGTEVNALTGLDILNPLYNDFGSTDLVVDMTAAVALNNDISVQDIQHLMALQTEDHFSNNETLPDILDMLNHGTMDGRAFSKLMDLSSPIQPDFDKARAGDLLEHVQDGNLGVESFNHMLNGVIDNKITVLGLRDFTDLLTEQIINADQANDFAQAVDQGVISSSSFETLFDLMDDQNRLNPDSAVTLLQEVQQGDISKANAESLITELNESDLSQNATEYLISTIKDGHTQDTEVTTLLVELNSHAAELNSALSNLASGNDIDQATFDEWPQSVQDIVSDFQNIDDPLAAELPDPDGSLFALDIPDENMEDITGSVF